jgi:WD repeat-containing protein 1 (actin-interacting protein 1)
MLFPSDTNAHSELQRRPTTAPSSFILELLTSMRRCTDTRNNGHLDSANGYTQTIKSHTPTKFVTDVRFSPSGDHFASTGSDAKSFLYDGKTGDVLGEFEGDAHKGTLVSRVALITSPPILIVMVQTACSWSLDSKNLVTSGLDCAVKLCMFRCLST